MKTNIQIELNSTNSGKNLIKSQVLTACGVLLSCHQNKMNNLMGGNFAWYGSCNWGLRFQPTHSWSTQSQSYKNPMLIQLSHPDEISPYRARMIQETLQSRMTSLLGGCFFYPLPIVDATIYYLILGNRSIPKAQPAIAQSGLKSRQPWSTHAQVYIKPWVGIRVVIKWQISPSLAIRTHYKWTYQN